jgi:hypothetical protein
VARRRHGAACVRQCAALQRAYIGCVRAWKGSCVLSALPLSRAPSRLRWRTFPSFQRIQAMNTGGFFGLSGREMLDAERAAERALRAAAYHMGVADQALIGQQRARSASLVLADGGAAEATRWAGVACAGRPHLRDAQGGRPLTSLLRRRSSGPAEAGGGLGEGARSAREHALFGGGSRLTPGSRSSGGRNAARLRGGGGVSLLRCSSLLTPASRDSLFAFGCNSFGLGADVICGCPDAFQLNAREQATCALAFRRRCAMLEPRARSVVLHLSCFTVMENSAGLRCYVRASMQLASERTGGAARARVSDK